MLKDTGRRTKDENDTQLVSLILITFFYKRKFHNSARQVLNTEAQAGLCGMELSGAEWLFPALALIQQSLYT